MFENLIVMRITDTHLHIWNTARLHYPWLDEVPSIRKNYEIQDYGADAGQQVAQMIFVQCECLPDQYKKEIGYVSAAAESDPRIAGIVSWFPLHKPGIDAELEELVKNPLIRGIRRLEESPVSLYSNPVFTDNLSLLKRHRLSFDICLKAWQLPEAVKMVDRQPDIAYMLDHCGKPDIKNGELVLWKENIRLLADNPRVYCKISGLVTEADWNSWTPDDLKPYFDFVTEQFGADRIVFGSDWPVVNLASGFRGWLDTFLELCRDFSEGELAKVLYENAQRFYRITA